jgi:hydrophobe/amphiphile efflux-1 (HAE1) family protein
VSWPRLALRHRYTVFAVVIAVVVLGGAARFGLPIQLFPDTDPPVVTVITPYPGVAAADVAKNLSKALEEELSGIDGVRRVSSTSQTGLSVVRAEFHYTRRVEDAAVDTQNAISRIRGALPATIGEPQVLQFSSADKPILTAALDGMSLAEVRELADNAVRDRLQLVPGVAAVDVVGGHKRQLEVTVHRDRLQAYGLDIEAVQAALRAWNLTEPGGRIEQGAREAVVRFDMPIADAADAAALVIAQHGERRVLLRDVADVRVTEREPRSAYRYNGAPAIAVQVLKRSEANTVEVARALRAELGRIGEDYPSLRIQIADDDSVFTELVIGNMTSSVFIAIVLTVIVVFLFLARLRQAAIIAISIPVSFLMTFALMYASGIELNMVTMSAIILSIGLLVDDAILVLENVDRHLTVLGKTAFAAALEGAEEIFSADLAGSITTIAVLVPLMFLGGFVGKLFGPLAWTLGFALASSFIVSVTLIPLLAALWLRPGEAKPGRLAQALRPFEWLIEGLKDLYLALLGSALAHPWRTLVVALLLLVAGFRLMALLGSEMLPRFDSGTFQVVMDTAPGTRLEDTLAAVRAIERRIRTEPTVVGVSTLVGYEPGGRSLGERGALDVNQAQITVNLTPRTTREDTLWEVMDRVRTALYEIPGVTLGAVKEKGGTARATTAAPIDVRLSGPDAAVLDGLADAVLERLRGVSGTTDLYKTWALDTPEVHVVVDRERAAELGLAGQAIARAVYEAVEGQVVTPFRQARARDLDVFVRYAAEDRRHALDLADVQLRTPDGAQVPLRDLARLEERLGPRIVTREDHRQTLDVLGYNRGRPLSDTVADIRAALADLALPEGYRFDITGEQSDFEESRSRMLRALALGILAVYLILVAQFRSFKHPFTVMFAVPLQFLGVAAALLIAGKYVSMPALLGIILLTGTVVNNSIVLIDYILARRDQGLALEAAILESVSVRYRPIMMTALSDVAGMLPLALELAVGAERFSPIATVVIGGILAATLLTLVVIPVLFLVLERIAWPRWRRGGVATVRG